jgi:hypothetical protein
VPRKQNILARIFFYQAQRTVSQRGSWTDLAALFGRIQIGFGWNYREIEEQLQNGIEHGGSPLNHEASAELVFHVAKYISVQELEYLSFAESADDVLAIDLFNVVRRKELCAEGLRRCGEVFQDAPHGGLQRDVF